MKTLRHIILLTLAAPAVAFAQSESVDDKVVITGSAVDAANDFTLVRDASVASGPALKKLPLDEFIDIPGFFGAVSKTELLYLDGVTSAVQTQLNGKQPTIADGTLSWAKLTGQPTTLAGYGITDAEPALGNPGGTGYVLTSSTGGLRQWAPPNLDLNAANLTIGTVAIARLGSGGTPSSSTYLRGDNTWASVAGGGGDLTSGPVTSSGGVSTIVDNALSIAKTSGLQTALDLKAPLANPNFTGTVAGITAAMVGAPAGSGTSTGTNTGDQTNITGNAATVTTNANLTGVVTSTGNTTAIADGAIGLAKLATGSAVAGQVPKLNGSGVWVPGTDTGADPLTEAPALYDVFSDKTRYAEGRDIRHNVTTPITGSAWKIAVSNQYSPASLQQGSRYRIAVVGTGHNWTSIGAASAVVGVDFIKNSTAGTGTGEAALLEDHQAGSFVTGRLYRILSNGGGSTNFTLIGAADSNPGTDFTATGPGTGTGSATSKVVPRIVNGALTAPFGMSHYYLGNSIPSPNKRFTIGTRFKWFSTPMAKYRSGTVGPPNFFPNGSLTNFSFSASDMITGSDPTPSIAAAFSPPCAHLNMAPNLDGGAYSFLVEAVVVAGTATGNAVNLTYVPVVSTAFPNGYQLTTGDYISVGQGAFTLPTGLTDGGKYYAIMDNANTMRFATSRANALAGVAITLSGAGTAGWSLKQEFEEVESSWPTNNTVFKVDGEYTLLVTVDNDTITTTIPGYGYRKYYHPRLSDKVGEATTNFWIEPNGLGIPPDSYYPEGIGLTAVWGNSSRLNEIYSGVMPGTRSADTTTTTGRERNFREINPLDYPHENTTPALSDDYSWATFGKVASMGMFPSATLEMRVLPSNDETIILKDLSNGNITVKWKTALSTGPTVPYEVLIGATPEACVANLNACIMNTGGIGTIYSTASTFSQHRSYAKDNLLHVELMSLTTGTIALSETMANPGNRWMQANMKPAIIPAVGVMGADVIRNAPITYTAGQTTAYTASNGTGATQNLLGLLCPPMYAIGNSADIKVYGRFAANSNPKKIDLELGFAGASPITLTTNNPGDTTFTITGRLVRGQSGFDRILFGEIQTNPISATGSITYGSPADGDTVVVNGTTLTKAATTSVVADENMVNGQVYVIKTTGTTTFNTLGALSNTVGLRFTYNGTATSGTGDVYKAAEFSTITELEAIIEPLVGVTSTENGTTVTITSDTAGIVGNNVTLSETGAMTVSGATLTGGRDGLRVSGRQTENQIPTIQNAKSATVITTTTAASDVLIDSHTVTHNY